ncbi:hypothetical protein LINGRAHAP2_LOCUS29710 [Linum grandiflorum]
MNSSSPRSSSKAMILLVIVLIITFVEMSESVRDIPPRPSSGPSTVVLHNIPSSLPLSKSSSPPRNRDSRARSVFGRKEVKNCLPKGFRHTSAPSRYVNYQPLGSCV